MGDDELTRRTVLYGSAGMAAAGMIPGAKASPKPKPEEEEVEPEEPPAEAEAVAEPVEEASVPEEPYPEPEPAEEEIIELKGLKAAVLGHTGAGNFGHGLDVVFNRLDGVRLVAISDEDDVGLEKAHTKTGAINGYESYRELFENEQPDIVAVAPRWTDQHHAMVEAALIAGAHVYCEKPFTRTLKEADELLKLAEDNHLKIAVAHQMRCDPYLKRFHAEQKELIGELLEMRVYGKMDHRVGGEDMLVLGTHLFDIVRLFGGEVQYCTARISKDGSPAIAEDAHESKKENLGPLLGDSIRAEFVMDSGISVTFISDERYRDVVGSWGIEFIGTKSTMRLFANHPPTFSLLERGDPGSTDRFETWKQWPEVDGEYHPMFEKLTGMDSANRRVIKDFLDAIETDREPESSGERAMKALELIHGVWQAGATMKRAYFPLTNRLHPLSEESR
ncbi:MAG: Gfo/Idh/MocA family oxidoreductase [Verrucomicrobiales bacterium]|nr:Gfo/Idh/MocA family oxidoreductase [Verrucomicrobiales bacterium]